MTHISPPLHMPTTLLDIAPKCHKALRAFGAASCIFMTSALAHGQSSFTWNTGNGSWTDNSSWTLTGNASGYPDTAADLVYFSQNTTTIDIAMPTDSTAVAGAITMNGSGVVRLGNSTTFSGSLKLEAGEGQSPLFEVNGTRLAIFTELTGTQGFRKTGTGTLGFQTNPLDMVNLSGNVSIEQGTVWFTKAGSFGTGPINLSGNGTVLEMRSGAAASSTSFTTNQTFRYCIRFQCNSQTSIRLKPNHDFRGGRQRER